MSTDALSATLEQSPVRHRRRRHGHDSRRRSSSNSSRSCSNSCSATQPYVSVSVTASSSSSSSALSSSAVVTAAVSALAATTPATTTMQTAVDESRQRRWLDRARQNVHCSWFCGGARCKHESWQAMKPSVRERAAIHGLNAHWVGKNVIASQRPSTSLFAKYALIDQFRRAQVTGVLNLQEKGEHSLCGPDGVYERSGYSYSGTHDLMPHGISYYEFPWADMTAPQQDIVLRSVQVMDYHIKNKGKVLVHCHAGLGRTGLLIACYCVYSQHIPSADAIARVRGARPGAIQTTAQGLFVRAFEQHLWRLAHAFCRAPASAAVVTSTTAEAAAATATSGSAAGDDAAVYLDVFVQRQRYLLHGEQADLYRCVPMFLHVLLCRLLNLTCYSATHSGSAGGRAMTLRAMAALSPHYALDDDDAAAAVAACRDAINCRRLRVQHLHDAAVLSYLVVHWFRTLATPALAPHEREALLHAWQQQQQVQEQERSVHDVDDDATTSACMAPLLRQSLSKTTRHTLGMVISAYYTMLQHYCRHGHDNGDDDNDNDNERDVDMCGAACARTAFAQLAEAFCGNSNNGNNATTLTATTAARSRRHRRHRHPHDGKDSNNKHEQQQQQQPHATRNSAAPTDKTAAATSTIDDTQQQQPLTRLRDVLLAWGASVSDAYFDFDRVPPSHRTLKRIALASSIVLRNTAVTPATSSRTTTTTTTTTTTAETTATASAAHVRTPTAHTPTSAVAPSLSSVVPHTPEAAMSPTSEGLAVATQQASHALEVCSSSSSDDDDNDSSSTSSPSSAASTPRWSSASSFADIERSTHAWLLSTLNSRSAAMLTLTPCTTPHRSSTSKSI